MGWRNNHQVDLVNKQLSNIFTAKGRLEDIGAYLCPNSEPANFVISGGSHPDERYQPLYIFFDAVIGRLPVIILHNSDIHVEAMITQSWQSIVTSPDSSPLWIVNQRNSEFEPFFGMDEMQVVMTLRQLAYKLNYSVTPRFERVVKAHLDILKELNVPISLSGLNYLCKFYDMGEFHENIMALPCGETVSRRIWADLGIDSEDSNSQFDLFRAVISNLSHDASHSGWNDNNCVSEFNCSQAIEHNATFLLSLNDMYSEMLLPYLAEELKSIQTPFILIIDEWDCIFREYKQDKEAQEKYLDFLRDLLKDKACIYLSYMTGILPIKKYGTHSALNMFDEFSMIAPGPLACYVGFTEQEVKKLCEQYGMDMEEVKNWYDGYSFDGVPSVYSPRSVVNSMRFQKISNYWNQTETFEALQVYIDMNFEHLKDDVLSMIAGESVAVNTESFTNDMATFRTEDDVLTLLIHLGYLAYDDKTKTVKIPNSEIRAEYVNTVSVSDWGSVSKALKDSADTLNAIWQGREEQVSKAIEQAHFETSHIQYNDENALSYTISLALYAARNFYTIHRELAGGKGFADLVFIPKKQFAEKPALVVELKWDKSAEGAIKQIKDKKYFESLEEYQDNLLLIGINYDKKTKEHVCKIEKY